MTPAYRFSAALRGLCAFAFLFTVAFIFLHEPPPRVMELVWDKWVHSVVYGGLAFLLWVILQGRWRLAIWIAIVAIGALDETHQYFTPGRDAGVDDLAADAIGSAVVLLILHALGPRIAPQ